MTDRAGRPVRVAAVNDYDLIVEGMAGLLSRYPDRVHVCDRIVVGEPIGGDQIDVALYDSYGRVGVAAPVLAALADRPEIRHVALFSLDLRAELVAAARDAGATGFVSKALPGDAIVDAIVRIAAGEEVELAGTSSRSVEHELDWPGRADGLTERESQVLVLCAEGLTNREIAGALYVGVETVKSHLTNVYRRLGVRNRIQAATYVERAESFRRRAAPVPPGGGSRHRSA